MALCADSFGVTHMSLLAAGADFTNTFRSLSQIPCPSEEDSADDEEQVKRGAELLLQQCSSWEELKAANKPTMDPRWVPVDGSDSMQSSVASSLHDIQMIKENVWHLNYVIGINYVSI